MSDCFQDESTAPGAKIPVKGDILLNAQRKTVKLKVTSLCDRPIQVCTQFVSYALWHDVVVSVRQVSSSCDYFYLIIWNEFLETFCSIQFSFQKGELTKILVMQHKLIKNPMQPGPNLMTAWPYPAQCISAMLRNATQHNRGRQNFFNFYLIIWNEFLETFSSILFQKGDITKFSGNLFLLFAFLFQMRWTKTQCNTRQCSRGAPSIRWQFFQTHPVFLRQSLQY